ncbi:hypothetical protein ACROYT_G035791 [Oculina patagonica]
MPVRSQAFSTLVAHNDLHRASYLLFLVYFLGVLSGSASLQARTCRPSLPKFNVTLRAGSASGIFWKLGRVNDVEHCGQLCCRQQGCDLAFSVDNLCYNVECYSEKMCRLKKGNFSRHNVAVTLVTRSSINAFHGTKMSRKSQNKDEFKNNANKIISKDNSSDKNAYQKDRTLTEEYNASKTTATKDRGLNASSDEGRRLKELKNKYQNASLNSYESKEKGTGFEISDSFPTKAVVSLESKLLHNGNSESTKSGSCRARRVLRKVTLRSGLKSGDFSDYGEVPDINACVKHCCEQQTCDVSLLLNKHCYTLHCYKPELCKIMPSHDSKIEPQLAFVTRSASDDKSSTRVKKKASSSNGGACPHGAIFSDVSLRGGHKAGKFELLAGAKDMRSCIQKCCASPSCQVAWLLGDHCYSVACYDKCITVKKHSSGIRSQLTLLTRKTPQTGNDNKVFTVFLTVKNQIFTDRLKDIESLEFLNLAEKLQVAVSSVFVNVPSYKTAEVVSFQPGPVVANLKLTTEAKATASQILTPLVKAVKSGQLKSSIDGTPITFTVSDAGFRFLTSTGLNLVCGAEHDYDINWKLVTFNSTDNQICPRKAQGQTSRFCAGSETTNATWLVPNFSECVSPEYKKLHQESKDLANRAEKKLPFAAVSSSDIITRLEKLVFADTYREELYNRALSDQNKRIRAAKKRKGQSSSKIHDKATFVKTPAKKNKKEDSSSVPVTEIPRLKPEILPTTSSTAKNEAQNPVWFSDLKTKLTASNPDNNVNGKSLIHPTTAFHLVPTSTTRVQTVESPGGVPVQLNGNAVINQNRIPTQSQALKPQRPWGLTGNENPVARSRVLNTAQSKMANQRQNLLAFNRAQYKNPSPMRNALQRTQVYQRPNPQLAPGYARPPNPYQWPGSQAWQGNRAGVQRSWGRGYSPPSFSSDQMDIGRRKREIRESDRKHKRQNTLWYTAHQYPSRMNYLANQGRIPSTSYQQPRNYYQQQQNAYQRTPNQAATNPYQTRYPPRAPYGQSLGMGLSPAGQQPQRVAAVGLRSQIKTAPGYGTQPGVVSGGHPVPVERWPTLGTQIQKPTSPLLSQNAANTASPSSRSRIELNTNKNPTQNAKVSQTDRPAGLRQPALKITSKLPSVHVTPKQNENSRTSGSKKAGPQNDLSKKLHDLSAPPPQAKVNTQIKAQKRQNTTVPQMGRNEKHIVPMFGGDILLSVGVLQLLQKFARLTEAKFTEKDLKSFVNASSHLLDLKNKDEWSNAQKHAEVLFKRGINVLEDSSNWDWDESQQMTSQDSTIGPVVLDLVRTVQEHVMNASYSVPVTKPLLTKNILVGEQTFGSDSSDPTIPMSFPNYSNPLVANWSTGHDSITLTPSIFDSAVLGKSVQVHLLMTRFKTVSQLLPTKKDSGLVLNSAVLSSTARPAVTEALVPPVKVVMSVLNSSLIKFEQECVAWASKEGQGGGEWSSKGCKLTSSNATHTTCECNHMTDFAILADTNKGKGVGAPHPSAAVPSPAASHDRSWIGILLGILAVLVLIIIVIVLLFYWRKRRRNQEQGGTPRPRSRALRRSRSLSRSSARPSRSSSSKSEGAASPASSHSSQFDEMIAARRRRMAQDKQEKARRAQEEGEEEGDDELLMKEKAMLFSDYHQPYHFLSKEEEARAAANGREQPGPSRHSPPRRSRRSAMEQEGDDV